jgi:hypothetical protein
VFDGNGNNGRNDNAGSIIAMNEKIQMKKRNEFMINVVVGVAVVFWCLMWVLVWFLEVCGCWRWCGFGCGCECVWVRA